MSSAAPASDTPDAEAAPSVPATPNKRRLGLILAALGAVLAAGGGAYMIMGRSTAPATTDTAAAGESPQADKGTARYLALQPAFVVNLADDEAARYLQVEMEVMARDAQALDQVSTHMPRIRNSLLLLLGIRRVSDLATREGKEKLLADVTLDIQNVLRAETGKPQIEAVYFNSFVMQ